MRAFPCGVFTEFSAARPERAVSEQLASYLQRPRVEDVHGNYIRPLSGASHDG
jgi:hypothetical protein